MISIHMGKAHPGFISLLPNLTGTHKALRNCSQKKTQRQMPSVQISHHRSQTQRGFALSVTTLMSSRHCSFAF